MDGELHTQLGACPQQVTQGVLDDLLLTRIQPGLYQIVDMQHLRPPCVPDFGLPLGCLLYSWRIFRLSGYYHEVSFATRHSLLEPVEERLVCWVTRLDLKA